MKNIILLSAIVILNTSTNLYAQDTITTKDVNTVSFVLSTLINRAAENGNNESKQLILIYSNAFDMIKKEYPDSVHQDYITYFQKFKTDNKGKIDGISIYMNKPPMGIFLQSERPCPCRPSSNKPRKSNKIE